MKKLAIVFSVLFLMLLGVEMVNAQNEVTSNPATASARIIQTLQISKDRDIDFGTFTAVNGNVVLTPVASTVRSTTGPVLSGGVPTSAMFTVTGSAGEAYTVSYPASITLTNTFTPGQTMILAPSCNVNGNAGVLSGTIGGGTGTQVLYVGGTLAVAATNTTGLYQNTADLKVTVNYN